MTQSETQAIVTVSLLAAFVDGDKHERERTEIKRIADGLAQAEGVHLPTLYQDVLMKRVSLTTVLPALSSNESRQLAYEMAVCVCDADGAQSSAEQSFLADLSGALRLDASSAGRFATHGYELDRGDVKDFLTTAGVGLTSQYLEQAGRKLLGAGDPGTGPHARCRQSSRWCAAPEALV